jgi:hypothetical protein
MKPLSEFILRELSTVLLGKKIGRGIHRHVFNCRIDPTLVVKIEPNAQSFSNVAEWQNWNELSEMPDYNRWLAPCVAISSNGAVLLQKRAKPLHGALPEKLPSWIMDIKRENFGMYEGRIVLCDYPTIYSSLSKRLRKVDWRE